MKRILVPTDFSSCAENATQIAKEVAKKIHAEIHFLHFTAIPIDWVNLNSDQGKMYPDVTKRVKECQDQLNKLVRVCEKEDIKASSYIGYNESYQNIIDHITNHKIDLVIIGSHGASGLKGAIIGSNAQKVIRLSTAPVLVIKQTTRHFDAKKMVIASNFPDGFDSSEAAHMKSYLKLLSLADELKLEVDLLYVNTPAGFTSSKIIKYRMEPYQNHISKDVNTRHFVINANNLEEGIADYMEDNEGVIIGMITHGETGLNRLFKGSHVEDIANHVSSSILSVKMI